MLRRFNRIVPAIQRDAGLPYWYVWRKRIFVDYGELWGCFMRNPGTTERQEEEPKKDFLEKRGFTWGALLVLLIVTLIAALVLAYLMTVRNFPTH